MTDAPARGGRPREPRIDEAVREAVSQLLVEGGYARLTVEAVATRAGVGHASIYRRWPAKPHMVFWALFPDDPAPQPDPPIGPPAGFETHLRAFAHRLFDRFAEPGVRAATVGLLSETLDDPDLGRAMIDRFQPASRRALRDAANADVGAVRDDVDTDLLYDALIATAMTLPGQLSRAPTPGYVDDLVDVLLRGALSSRAPTRASPSVPVRSPRRPAS